MNTHLYNKLVSFRFFVAAAVALMLTASCSQDSEDFSASGALRFMVTDAGDTRAVTDGKTMLTVFEQGDVAGLYAVSNGQVILDNIPLTYSVNGFWEATTKITATDNLQNARFFAYYPYSEDAVFDASADKPFTAMLAASKTSGRQSTKSDYEAADVMVSNAAVVGQYNTVSLALQHQKAVVCVELPNTSYIFSNQGMAPYVMSKSENVQFSLNGNSVQPFFDEDSQSYRLIVEPGQEGLLAVSFTSGGNVTQFDVDNLSMLQAGQYAKFVISGGAQLVNTTLQVGDFYCADGRLVAKDTPESELPDNIVGIVFKLGTTEAVRSANPDWCHGVVVSLQEVRGKWGNNSSPTSEQNSAGWRYWYRDYGLADQGSTNATALTEDNMFEEGYETTLAWRAVPEPLEIGGSSMDYTSEMNANYNSWVTAHPLPAGINSGWYVPSLRDLQTLEAESAVLSQQLTMIGATDLLWNTGSSDRYWSCNVRGAGSNWCYVGGKTALGDRYKGVACSGNSYYRFLFAF